MDSNKAAVLGGALVSLVVIAFMITLAIYSFKTQETMVAKGLIQCPTIQGREFLHWTTPEQCERNRR